MKSLQESLFDQDLIKKGVKITFDNLWNILSNTIRKNDIENPLLKKGWKVWPGKQAWFLRKSYPSPSGTDCDIEFEFGITKSIEDHDVPSFNVPVLKVLMKQDSQYRMLWKPSRTAVETTSRQIRKKLGNALPDSRYTSIIDIDDNSLPAVLKLYEDMFKFIASDQFDKLIKHYILIYDHETKIPCIPGLVLDTIMKNVITKV